MGHVLLVKSDQDTQADVEMIKEEGQLGNQNTLKYFFFFHRLTVEQATGTPREGGSRGGDRDSRRDGGGYRGNREDR